MFGSKVEELWEAVRRADRVYDVRIKLADDPIVHRLVSSAGGFAAGCALGRIVGCAVVAQSGGLVVVGRYCNVDAYTAFWPTVVRERNAPECAAILNFWAGYTIDSLIDDSQRRAARIAIDRVKHKISELYPALRAPGDGNIITVADGLTVGGILK